MLPYREPGLHYKLPWPIERLTRIQARRVRVVEVGFRSNSATPDAEPAAYEWNVQHRSGRFQRKPEESLMLTGDQNMIELNATVHYHLVRPGRLPVPAVGRRDHRARGGRVGDAVDRHRHAARRRADHGAPGHRSAGAGRVAAAHGPLRRRRRRCCA